jgi:hypothetical protein
LRTVSILALRLAELFGIRNDRRSLRAGGIGRVLPHPGFARVGYLVWRDEVGKPFYFKP